MKFKQFYLGCLSHASYYIGSNGEAAIVDPQRDVEQYLSEAEVHGQKIKYIIETHLHADFVSGHKELAEKTGAKIVFGEKAKAKFEHLAVKENDEIKIGNVKLKILETPGHTPEGISIIVENTKDANEPKKVLTGDTLFIGDVGRPDLVGSKGFTAEEMAAMLYDSLREKLMKLPDETEVYPAHGAGSLCGKNMSKEKWSTISEQKEFNHALQPMSKARFVEKMSSGLMETPAYFAKSVEKNLAGAGSLEKAEKPKRMNSEEVKSFAGVVLDIRTANEFGAKHIPHSLNIGLGGQFASWAGILIEIGEPIVVVADSEEKVDEAVMRLARVGHETVKGAILIDDYDLETEKIEQVSVQEAAKRLDENKDLQIVDVRREAEYVGGHAPKAVYLTLSNLEKSIDKLDKNKPTYVICAGGYRSSAGTSILERKGFTNLHNISGGTSAWIEAGFETEEVGSER